MLIKLKISGGPVYVSDKIGESDPKIIKKLCFYDGRIPLLNRSAKPCEDVIFTDVTKTGLLKINNIGDTYGDKKAGVIAAFNITDSRQKSEIRICDILEMKNAEKCYVYDYLDDTVITLNDNDSISLSLNSGEYAYYIFLPYDSCTPLGLIEKYLGFKAVKERKYIDEKTYGFVMEEIGKCGFVCDENIKCVMLNDEDVTDKLLNKRTYYCLDLEESNAEGTIIITVD